MKLAILADIHANFVALQTVTEHLEAWQPNMVIVAGDVVNRGPRPLECLHFVQEKQRSQGWLTVRGNHEDYVIDQAQPDAPQSGPVFEVFRNAYWTYRQLGCDVASLEAMPFQINLAAPDGSKVTVTHASLRHNRDGIFPKTSDDELRQKIGTPPLPALFCVGHTHWPLIRRLDNTLVVNVGSAGLPFDGNYQVSYAQLQWQHGQWQTKIIRLDYDFAQAERDFFTTGFMEGSGPLAHLILNELRTARPRLFFWASQYQDRALTGEITMEESVREFMTDFL